MQSSAASHPNGAQKYEQGHGFQCFIGLHLSSPSITDKELLQCLCVLQTHRRSLQSKVQERQIELEGKAQQLAQTDQVCSFLR